MSLIFNLRGIIRIIQSIPSPKAEPFKRWLTKVGYELVQEIEDPELAQKRMKDINKLKGYSDAWIEKRVRGIAVKERLFIIYRDDSENRSGRRGTQRKQHVSAPLCILCGQSFLPRSIYPE